MTSRKSDNAGLLREILDAIPSVVFAVDQDMRILDYNTAAAELVGADPAEVLSRRGGDALHCLRATETPEGCGHAESCKTCVLREAAEAAFAGRHLIRRRALLELRTGAGARPLHALVTASPLVHEGRPLAVLVLEDINDLVDLQRIVPICMQCRKVRDDDLFWKEVEAYFHHHWDLRFSHGLCPDCARAYREQIGEPTDSP
jgi:PAS domain-containing protein